MPDRRKRAYINIMSIYKESIAIILKLGRHLKI